MNSITQNGLTIKQEAASIVRTWRTAKKMSQEALSEESGVSVQMIRAIESEQTCPTIDTLQKIARGLGLTHFTDLYINEPPEKHPILSEVPLDAQFTTHLPVFNVEAACGYLAEGAHTAEILGWVAVDPHYLRHKLTTDMLVVRAKGDSMEPLIHDGDLCVFERYQGGSREGLIMLFNLVQASDPVSGANCLIKRYHSERRVDDEGQCYLLELQLLSCNPNYSPICFTEESLSNGEIVPLAVFRKTL